MDSPVEHVDGLIVEVKYAREEDVFEASTVESLQPGSILSPCFEVEETPPEYSHITEQRTSFSKVIRESSGCINEIRASAFEPETIVSSSETVDVVHRNSVCEETVTKVHVSCATPEDENKDLPDVEYLEESVRKSPSPSLDHSFDVTCTSNFLPKTDHSLRHVTTTTALEPAESSHVADSPKTPTDDEVDYTKVASWRNQTRQLFILSDSGKPIYSRHGEEDKLVTLCGVMQAMVSVINDSTSDNLWSITAIGTRISFLVRTPLILVTVAKTGESDRQLIVYLNYAYEFILSVLTLPQLLKIFVRYQNFDLRRMLSGTEKILDHLIDWFDEDMGFLLGSVRCLPLPPSLRENINSQLTHSCQKIPGLVFAVVIAKRQLISVARLKKYVLHPSDIRILINLIDASDSFKTGESWIPICLPKFDSSGFLHTYISYLRDSPVCLVYLGVDPNLFHPLAKSSAMFCSKMDTSGNLTSLLEAMTKTSFYSASQSGVPELRHFIYKSSNAAQLTSPVVTHPYRDKDERNKLRGFYRYLHRRMHCPARAARIILVTSNTEMLLGWAAAAFELYAILEPSMTKHNAVLAIEKLIRWIKKEENTLFILNSPVFN